jgi:hypothetical protein
MGEGKAEKTAFGLTHRGTEVKSGAPTVNSVFNFRLAGPLEIGGGYLM